VAKGNNLPVRLTAFVGRQEELASLRSVLDKARLVTLTGVGGAGKTRLAARLAEIEQGRYPGGCWFIELAPVIDRSLLIPTLMTALGIIEPPEQTDAMQSLTDALQGRRALLLLDSCEHLVEACAFFVEHLLRACPDVTVVATSQETLRVDGEVVWRVPSLSLAPDDRAMHASTLVESDAVQLFVDRARLVKPAFEVNDRNAGTIAQICRRLDGLPLAIELAAATTRVMPEEEILRRLEDRFRLLTGGARTAMPRHQTLRAAVEWSYGHLDDTEQTMFRRLSVFNGGFDIDAAEAVVETSPAQPATLLSVLTGIADKSLLSAEESQDGRARFKLLETLRQFGQERLDELDVDVRRRHAEHYLRLATEAQPHIVAAAQDVWLHRLAQEQDNIRAALAWGLATEPSLALQLAATVGRFWVMRGQLREGHSWLSRALDEAPRTHPLRAKGLTTAAWLAYKLGLVARAEAMATEALSLATSQADRDIEARALNLMGVLREHLGDHEEACAYLTRCVAVVRELGDRTGEAAALNNLALALQTAGDLDTALDRAGQSLDLARRLGDRYALAMTLDTLARIELDAAKFEDASAHVREILLVAPVAGDAISVANGLEGAALLAGAQRIHERSLALAGAAAAVRDRVGTYLPKHRSALLEATIAQCREALGVKAAGLAWSAGRRLSEEEAIALGVATCETKQNGRAQHDGLSPREMQVAALIANGLSNKEIATKLHIAVRTADAHVEHIRNKLGLRTRAQIAVWAHERLGSR
jgi:predicted ATPase/DNA-binding CsgD family transcriptional regulator